MKMLRELCQVWNRKRLSKIPANPLIDFSHRDSKLGIALGFSSEDQLHCGIVYKRDNDSFLLHLKWHHLLSRDMDFTSFMKYVYVEIGSLHEDRIESICSMCETIYSRHDQRKIPYGIKYSYGNSFVEGDN